MQVLNRMTKSPVLDVSGLAKRFGKVVALRSASLSVAPGEVHALMGANGAGKSTLVKVLTGALRGDGGTILLNGAVRSFRSPREAREGGIVSVYQDPALVPDLSIRDNFRVSGVDFDKGRAWFAKFGLARLDPSTRAGDVPLAKLRMIDLARALASDPQILMLDEITASLSADLAELAFDAVRKWRDMGRSIIFISHRLAEISSICDRATVLRDGRTVDVIDPVAGHETDIVNLMLGPAAKGLDDRPSEPSKPQAPNARTHLDVRGLSVGHRLRDVSFTLRAGEVLGIAALEGQGQHELFECLSGSRAPDCGRIERQGQPLVFRHPADAIDAGIVLVPADRTEALLPHRSVRENVTLPDIRKISAWTKLSLVADRRRAAQAIAQLEVDTRAESEVRLLSGGNQQKVVIARWVASGFDVLLCYDPTRGIDVGTKRQIYTLLRKMAAGGASVLLYTSELAEIRIACDRALVMFGGQIVGEVPASGADEAGLLQMAHGIVSNQGASAS
jgi:ribose transport system ATP-binding protein